MIKTITSYELKYWLRQYPIYFYAGFLMMMGIAAMLIGGDILNEKTHNPNGDFWVNSPLAIHGNVINQLNILIFFLIPAIFGATINRDYNSKMHMILYSYPVKAKGYFLAKYLSASFTTIGIVLFLGIGIAIGENFPGLDPQFIGPFRPLTYLTIYTFFIIPNIFFFGAIVYTTVAVTRNIYTGYVVVLILILFRSIVGGTLSNFDYAWMAASLDPYAGMAGMFYSGEWSLIEKNTNMIPIKGVVIYNRMFWMLVSGLVVLWGKKRLKLTHDKYTKATPSALLQTESKAAENYSGTYDLESTEIDLSFAHQIKSCFNLAYLQFKTIISSRSFIALASASYILMFFLLGQVNPDLTSALRPFTQVILQIPTLFYTFLVSLLTFIYAGFLVHRLRFSKMDQIVDSTPISNTSMITAHIITVTLIQVVLISSILIVGVLMQVYSGQTLIDLPQYCLQLFGITLITLVIWTTLSLLIHAAIPNIYLGVFVLLITSIGIGGLGDLGIDLDVLKFNSAPRPEYSDLTGYKDLYSYFVHKGFWLLCGMILIFPTYLLWCRGTEQSLRSRIGLLQKRASNRFLIFMSMMILMFILFGSWIYSETVLPKSLFTDVEILEHKVKVEKTLVDYVDISQPSQVSFLVALDFYPEEKSYQVSAKSIYVNKSDLPIDYIWINSKEQKYLSYNLGSKNTIVYSDSIINITLLGLENPLEIGDSLSFSFEYKVEPHSSLISRQPILKGGSYLMPDFPDIGFSEFRITDSVERSGLGLEKLIEKEYLPQDSAANVISYVGKDLMDYEAILSTSDSEMAITSGSLIDQWKENGRNYFHYKSDGKIRNGFIYHSGEFEIIEEEYNGVNLSIYHHSDHFHNNGSMMKSMKATLDYCENYFGKYQFGSMKIVEFPRVYGNFAQSFGGLISYSEQAGFLINVDTSSSKRWDSPFRLTAHEMSHQWWGHQVIPSQADGSKFVTEGLAEYTAAKILEKHHGIEKLKRLIYLSRERYFRARKSLADEEPLVTVKSHQSIVAYHKGCLALLTFADFLGEDKLNSSLKNFVEKTRLMTSVYPTSLDLIHAIEAVTPDSLLYLIDDLTNKVILYDNKIRKVGVLKNTENKFEVDVTIQVSKFHGNKNGQDRFLGKSGEYLSHDFVESNEKFQSLPLNDYVKVAVYGEPYGQNESLLFEKNILFTDINTTISLTLDQEPRKVIIDPMFLLLDRDIDDNQWEL